VFGEKLKGLKDEKVKDSSLAIEKTISIIDNFLIASVALDSSAVFTSEPAQSSLEIQSTPQRKSVKSKAVAAMAEDGVDISRYIPMTVDELLLTLGGKHILKGHTQTSDVDRMTSAQPYNAQIKAISPLTKLKPSGEILYMEEEKSHLDDPSIEEEKSHFDDPTINNEVTDGDIAKIDHLIVLCSCGDSMKSNLMRCSKYVEEWDIEPPTAAAKSGEGDGAYRRVSLEIREEVNSMMESLLGTVLA